MLPALIESPGMFGVLIATYYIRRWLYDDIDDTHRPAYLQHLRAQFTSIIHALSSTFTTCACGSSTRDCAIRVMERVVDGKWPWPASEGGTSGSDREASAGEEESEIDLETVDSDNGHGSGGAQTHPGLNGDVAGGARSRRKKARRAPSVDLGPLVGVKRGFRTRERMPMSGGWHGVEVVPSSLAWPGIDEDDDKKAVQADVDVDSGVIRGGRGKKKRRNQEKDKRHVVADDVVVDVDGDENGECWKFGLELGVVPSDMTRLVQSPVHVVGQPDMDVDVVSLDQSAGGSGHVLPPRMRKSWIQQQQPSSSSNLASVAFADNETSVGPGRELNGGHYDLNGTSGQETEFDTETEGEDMVDGCATWTAYPGRWHRQVQYLTPCSFIRFLDTRQMPPPPMPASLDPTTVSSLAHAHAHIRRCSSPRAISAASKTKNMSESSRVPPRWMPSRTPTPAVASAVPGPVSSPQMQNEPASASVVPQAPQPGRASLSPQEQSLLVPFQLQSHPPRLEIPSNQSGTSPSVSFSKLSLLSADPPPQPSRNEPTVSPSLSPDVPAANQLQSHQGAPCRVSSLPPDDANPLSVHPCPPSSSNEVSTPATMYADSPREVDRRHPPVHTESSPGILDGFPALKTRGDDRMQDHNQECAKDATGDVNGLAGLSPHVSKVEEDADAMDVDADIDVVGDGPDKTGVEPSHDGEPLCVRRASGDNIFSIGPHGVTPIKPDPLSAFLHPQSSISSDLPSSERMPSPAPPEASHSELQPPNTPIPHQTEPEPEPSQPARVPSPPPPPKVKLSLRDFALRRKKQREEEMAAKSMLSPVALTSSALPSSPGRDEKVGEAVVAAGDVNMKDSAEDLKMSTGHAHEQAAPMDGSGVATSGSSPQHHNFLELSSAGSQTVKETDVIAQSLRVSPVPPRSLLSPPRAMHKYESDQTQSKDSPNPGKTLTAKLEIMEDVLPNGDAHSAVNDHTQGVVSLAPDPPPPPSSKAVAETNHVDGGAFASLPPSASTTSSSSSSSRSTSISTSISTHPSLHPSRSQLTPNSITTRRPSHEDGEIPSSTPPKAYVPRSHTPPTQPRSFQTTRPPSPSFSPSSSSVSRRPPAAPPPSVSRSAPGPGPVNSSGLSRPVPSGPRALRGTMNQSSYSTYPSTPARPYSGSQYIPRGPSADRDRMDWDRDRSWSASSRSRGRAGSGGWGR
ncbi:hypothetical protein ID866_9681 [Astraeus odoratus]|nr:hypothetical protein ID866_9681 [Astraeus odoratus]